jgi:hypothetical protein
MLQNLNALTRSDIDSLAHDILSESKRALSVAGNVKKRSFYTSFLPFI